jgi:hypothetical protein
MAPGSFKLVPSPLDTRAWPGALLVVRLRDGNFGIWRLGYEDGVPHVPERAWPESRCPGLTVDFDRDLIRCPADGELSAGMGASRAYEWTLDGKFTGADHLEPRDMPGVRFEEESGDLVLLGPAR